jgi:uncharacterized MAPEG superfamily protein
MTIAFWCVLIAAMLPYVGSFIAKAGARGFDNNEPRKWLARQEGFRSRANAAQQNGYEAFGFFAVAVIVAHITRGQQAQVDTLAMVFIAVRIAYLLVYLRGWGTIRTLVWTIGLAATVWIFITAAIPRQI